MFRVPSPARQRMPAQMLAGRLQMLVPQSPPRRFKGERKMPTPYRVEARGDGCPTCQHGATFDIIGPDSSSQGQSWGDPEEVEYICDLMNDAYQQGRDSLAGLIQHVIKETEEHEEEAAQVEPAPIAT